MERLHLHRRYLIAKLASCQTSWQASHKCAGDLGSSECETEFRILLEGRIYQTANWNDLHHIQFQAASNSYVASLLADGMSIEVRNASSGEVVSKYMIPRDPLLTTPMSAIDTTAYGKNWFRWHIDLGDGV